MLNILLVEDDQALAMGTGYALESEGMHVIYAADCASARQQYSSEEAVDLVLLDVMLPDGDGFALCEWMKQMHSDKPVIFLTALEDEGNVVHGLSYADDYVTKPFRTKELIARIYANTRKYTGRQQVAVENTVQSMGVFRLDEKNMAVYRQNERLDLTRNEYRLFQILFRHAGQVLTRGQLMEQLWSVDEAFVDDNTLSVYMRRLRAKIDQGGTGSYIDTIRGVGYRMRKCRES